MLAYRGLELSHETSKQLSVIAERLIRMDNQANVHFEELTRQSNAIYRILHSDEIDPWTGYWNIPWLDPGRFEPGFRLQPDRFDSQTLPLLDHWFQDLINPDQWEVQMRRPDAAKRPSVRPATLIE